MQCLAVSLTDQAERMQVGSMLERAYSRFRPHMAVSDWAQMLAVLHAVGQDPDGFNIVSRLAGEIAGHVAYYPPGAFIRFDIGPQTAFIRLFGVGPEFRGRAIARHLTEEAIELARSAGARAIALHTNELMTAAQALYRSMGFRQTRELPDFRGLRYALCEMNL